jgi:hypothetical protein
MDRPPTDKVLDPARIVGLLADEARLRTVAALTLGASTGAEAAHLAGLGLSATERALERLVRAGLDRGPTSLLRTPPLSRPRYSVISSPPAG